MVRNPVCDTWYLIYSNKPFCLDYNKNTYETYSPNVQKKLTKIEDDGKRDNNLQEPMIRTKKYPDDPRWLVILTEAGPKNTEYLAKERVQSELGLPWGDCC